MRICIIQSPYIPWRGFFDLISRCDEYVVYDSAQFVKRHWHNRNRIKTASGAEWLTIPVATKGRFTQPLEEVRIAAPWAEQHWRSLELAYRRAPFFDSYAPLVRGWYERAESLDLLTDVNLLFLREISQTLGITTRIIRDSVYEATGAKTERLVAIARAARASYYLSGPSARAYLEEDPFAAAGIGLEWMAYDNYARYPQLHGEFDGAVTVLDLLFNTGPDATRLIRTSAPKDPSLGDSAEAPG